MHHYTLLVVLFYLNIPMSSFEINFGVVIKPCNLPLNKESI
jgi:hypothetical protein